MCRPCASQPGQKEPRGLVRWLQAGEASGASLAEGIHRERGHFFDRRASDDEVLLLRAAYGLGVYVR